jgi:hypothetical protein
MNIGDKFCLDGMQGKCARERDIGCETCPSLQTYDECNYCGVDSSCTSIGEDGLCSMCRVMNDE